MLVLIIASEITVEFVLIPTFIDDRWIYLPNSFVVLMRVSCALAWCAKSLLVLLVCGLNSSLSSLIGEIKLVFGNDGYCSGSLENVMCWSSFQDSLEGNLRWSVLALV